MSMVTLDRNSRRFAQDLLALSGASVQMAAFSASPVIEEKALFDVAAERRRQVEAEGWTPERDGAHNNDELAQAAAVYAHPFEIKLAHRLPEYERGKNPWPRYDRADVSCGRGDCEVWGWEVAWLKKTNRRRDLMKAALTIAEIERLDRAALAASATEDGRRQQPVRLLLARPYDDRERGADRPASQCRWVHRGLWYEPLQGTI
jgi:hypothetical protein